MNARSVQAAYELIRDKRTRWSNEEEVRLAWVRALENGLGIDLHAERSHRDLSYNNVIIEFKAPSSFRGTKTSSKFHEATEERLLPYILAESRKTGLPAEDFIGIAIDGDHVCLAQVKDGVILAEYLIPFSLYAVELVMAALKADLRRSVTADNLLEDFGHRSSRAVELMQSLADGLSSEISGTTGTRTAMLYQEWKALYGQVADMSLAQSDGIDKELGFAWKGDASDAVSGRLFVIHTYNSLLVKLLGAQIVSSHGLTSVHLPVQAMAALNDTDLLKSLENDIELSGIFEDAGIESFVEESIFSWYLDLLRAPGNSPLMVSIRGVLAMLAMYRTDEMTHSRDVLRDLYQGLVPGKLRQSLGEYYTPDWLVDFTVAAAEADDWLRMRVLDPTCGSGSFLVAAIRLKKEEAHRQGMSDEAILDLLSHTVWGIDLNPLAVQIARVNYLMEVADLLQNCHGKSFEIPVLLGDAIYSPVIATSHDDTAVAYEIGSTVGSLRVEIPAGLIRDRKKLNAVFALMNNQVNVSAAFSVTADMLVAAGILTDDELDRWRSPLQRTYDRVLSMHARSWNGIWFRMARNYFWSANAGLFDLVIGNPPWVRWSRLPQAYRDRVKPTCESYGIFSETGRHGGNELDVSAMITYTVADKWLKSGGRLAFVITGSVFKNPSSAGFRNFTLKPSDPETEYLIPRRVDDFKSVKPFSDAANHTVVATFDKQATPPVYPVPYVVWSRLARTPFKQGMALTDALSKMSSAVMEAAPVDPAKSGSPWSVLTVGRRDSLKHLEGKCDWVAGRKGITTDLNGVYFVPVMESSDDSVLISSRPEAGKKDIGARRTAWVEPDLLFPLIKGASDFEPYHLKLDKSDNSASRLYTFLPNRGIQDADYRTAATLIASPGLRKTRRWFENYQDLLLNRSTYRRQMGGAPFHAIYNVGDYAFKPWKVVWPEMSTRFYAAVAGSAEVPLVGERVFIPDHKVYYASFDTADVAYYLCGLLNSPSVKEWVQSHIVSIQVGDIFKHLNVPEFNGALQEHALLVSLVNKAHAEHDADRRNILIPQIELVAEQILNGRAIPRDGVRESA